MVILFIGLRNVRSIPLHFAPLPETNKGNGTFPSQFFPSCPCRFIWDVHNHPFWNGFQLHLLTEPKAIFSSFLWFCLVSSAHVKYVRVFMVFMGSLVFTQPHPITLHYITLAGKNQRQEGKNNWSLKKFVQFWIGKTRPNQTKLPCESDNDKMEKRISKTMHNF